MATTIGSSDVTSPGRYAGGGASVGEAGDMTGVWVGSGRTGPVEKDLG
jgi:hypothetical protein